MNKAKGFVLASLLALSGTTALSGVAVAEDINIILCGDVVTPVYTQLFEEWNAANPDYQVVPELVGWGQCQDKVTTLAVAGTPVDIAYVGSRTLKQFAQNDLIVPVPMTEEERGSYYNFVPETVTFDGNQWGIP